MARSNTFVYIDSAASFKISSNLKSQHPCDSLCFSQTIDPKWLVELAPAFYKKGDPNQMTKAKKMEKIEPLYNRFDPPDAWRLSKRKG